MDWKGAQFMLYPEGQKTRDRRDAGLYFVVDSIDSIMDVIKAKAEVIEVNPGTEYGKKEIVFRDINGFQVTFGCDISQCRTRDHTYTRQLHHLAE